MIGHRQQREYALAIPCRYFRDLSSNTLAKIKTRGIQPSSCITMRSLPIVSRTSILTFISLFSGVSGQAYPGGTYYGGNGAPGAGVYGLIDDYQPSIFFDKFTFYTGPDPTNGHVKYVDRGTAERNGFATTPNGTARLSVDTTNRWPNGGPGRPSVRLVSNNAYTHGLFIFDASHMPTGCGTWPAYWLLGNGPEPWPKYGEIGEFFSTIL